MDLKTKLKSVCTINEAKDVLKISYQSTLNLIIRGDIEAEKMGWGWAIDKDSLKRHAKRKRKIEKRRAIFNKRNK